jgi:hypothetical protein
MSSIDSDGRLDGSDMAVTSRYLGRVVVALHTSCEDKNSTNLSSKARHPIRDC